MYGAGAGAAGLPRAAGGGRSDEADVVEAASWYLNLLHVGLRGQRDDGFKLGAADSAHRHRLTGFDVLRHKKEAEL